VAGARLPNRVGGIKSAAKLTRPLSSGMGGGRPPLPRQPLPAGGRAVLGECGARSCFGHVSVFLAVT